MGNVQLTDVKFVPLCLLVGSVGEDFTKRHVVFFASFRCCLMFNQRRVREGGNYAGKYCAQCEFCFWPRGEV